MTSGINPNVVGQIFSALNSLKTELEGLIVPILNNAASASDSVSEDSVQRVLDALRGNHAKVTAAVTKATGVNP